MLGRPNPRTMNNPAKSPARIQRKVRSSIKSPSAKHCQEIRRCTYVQSKLCAGDTWWAAAASVGLEERGYRMGNGARHGLGATGATNGTKAAVILANPIRATYRQQRRARRIETTSTASLGGRP